MAALSFRSPRPHRRPNLTPMIDVVFLLLVFFMLASRFGEGQGLPLALTGASGAAYSGPPRLIDVTPDAVRLNGTPVALTALAGALGPLMSAPGDTILLRARDGADLSALVAVMTTLRRSGLTALALVP